MTAADKITFVYLMFTDGGSFGKELLGIYGSKKAALSHMELVNGEVIPLGVNSKRVAQKLHGSTGQYWYVEKHVVRSGR